jgi:hypothetical protein
MRGILPLLLVGLLLSVGCLPKSFLRQEPAKGPELPYRSEEAVPVVTADGITMKTAWERAKALQAELDRESKAKH